MTETCQMCGLPVDLAVRHVTVTRQIETQTSEEVRVLDTEVMAYLHVACEFPLRFETTAPAGAVV